ncbi:hypothetical protein MUK42_13044 [Musa troglodytarum]|uniref:Uncharacterized protein n=1 Tax=Musa troglodytarum TaxID=320322 RepID=A0A9E7H7Y0_9LILI|nr:hypothetical protein MUK42_13044 [Musa troglodytarum]URE25167.1 hypothetical protein MUK42_13044 [Musa troglodytarum]
MSAGILPPDHHHGQIMPGGDRLTVAECRFSRFTRHWNASFLLRPPSSVLLRRILFYPPSNALMGLKSFLTVRNREAGVIRLPPISAVSDFNSSSAQ